MKYYINKENYHTFKTISVNRLDRRAYFIPYPDRESADKQSARSMRYNSTKVLCLSGTWDFRFYPHPADLPDVLDTDELDFDSIDVPSCWQFRGYDRPFYVNARYQFPYRPPFIPEEKKAGRVFSWFGSDTGSIPGFRDPGEEYNFVGVYRTFFSVTDSSKRYILSFLGAASCLDLYVNGSFTGYSEGSHNTSEFDITDQVINGRNELVVVIHRWCTGTYLECQDMFRNNGIFRDVLLRICDKTDVLDVDITTRRSVYQENTGCHVYDIIASVKLYGDTDVCFTLRGHGIYESRTVASSGMTAHVDFDVLNAKEWTAETPYLYDLFIETPGSCVKIKVGFRDVHIDGRIFLLNGQKIKLRGVNHHDTSPVNGYAMTPDEIERDIKLCKEYNIDTIRTSHYPPDPLLLDLCDEAGIYVVDEADLETHGTVFHKLPPSYNRISNDPKWAGHFVDRIKALYQRDKLHPSVIMWSLGNESGGYFNTDLMYMYLKSVSMLPVQYESAIHSKRKAYDVGSEMYPPASRLHDIGEGRCHIKKLNDRPYFMCEYAHAMGVGPGGMEDYWKEIYSYDNLLGGCVWEMNDHAVLHEDGSYTYGGDHGEWEHDGNFCVDGLFYPDRSPSSGAKLTRFIYRPLRIRYISGDRFEVFNTRSFRNASDYKLDLSWTDGTKTTETTDVSPLSCDIIHIDTNDHAARCRKAGIDCMVTVSVTDRATGKEVSREQLVIDRVSRDLLARDRVLHEHAHSENTITPMLSFKNGNPVISFGDTAMTASDPYTILFRAPTDNDFRYAGAVNTMKPFLAERGKLISIDIDDSRTVVKTKITCTGSAFICTDVYENIPEGILVTSTLHCLKGKGDLPRFGKAFRVAEDFDRVEYYGRNGESYADMKEHTQIEHVSCRVSDMTEPNIRPQESGDRCDTRWASVTDGRHTILFTAADEDFDLGIKPYSDRELLEMRHREDEKTTGTYVTISAFQQGLGTGICGPAPSPDVCYDMKSDHILKFVISYKYG